MIRIYFLFMLVVLITSCASDNKQTENATTNKAAAPLLKTSNYEWTQLTPNPGYSKAYNYQMFTVGKKVYVFHSDGVWESTDGITWTATGLPDIVKNQGFMDYVVFNDAVYAIGTFSGSLFDHILTTQIARTTDFKNWEILSKNSNLPKRFLFHPFVFQNKIWVIGGNNGETIFSDVWTSSDGVNWEKIADNLAFGERHSHFFVQLKDQLFMLSHDVWSSKDGIVWNMVNSQIAGKDITGYTPVVFDDKIWLIGSNQGGKAGSEVLYSEDGLKWETQQAPWSARGMVAACVFNDQILISGGRYGGTDPVPSELEFLNDVWALKKK